MQETHKSLRRVRLSYPSALPFRTFRKGQSSLCRFEQRREQGQAASGGVLSGAVEPIGAVLTLLAAQLVIPLLPYFLSFAAGAMLYVVVEELIPQKCRRESTPTSDSFFAAGFGIMMVLDVALG